MRLHRTHFFLAAILVFASTALAADDLLEPSPFAKEGISLNLPKSWKDQPHDADHPLLVASPAASDTDTTGDYTPVLIIHATPRPNSTGPINGDAQQANVAQEMTNYHITEKPQQLSINGLDAIAFGGTFTQGALKLRSRQFFILANDQLYSLTLITLASTWDQHLPALDASVHTFTVTGKK